MRKPLAVYTWTIKTVLLHLYLPLVGAKQKGRCTMNKKLWLLILAWIAFIVLMNVVNAYAKLTWDEVSTEVKDRPGAIAYIQWLNNVNYGGHSDWRLPTKKEVTGKKGQQFDATVWTISPCFSAYPCLKPIKSGDGPDLQGGAYHVLPVRGY
jgi:hypothetical protein